ncbi:MAG TPA: efflux RND transporter permease subunit, partial [Planctomycetaceae bacterium]
IPLRTLVSTPYRTTVPAEITHTNLAPTIDLTMGVYGRDLGHVADEVYAIVGTFGKPRPGEQGVWTPYDPSPKSKDLHPPESQAEPDGDTQPPAQPTPENSGERTLMKGSKIVLSGEYLRMKDTFKNLGIGLVSASVLIYFLMVALFRSYITPLVIMSAVPIGVTGVVIILYVTGTALNVQSLLGVVFMVGIVVSNTVLLTDFTQHIRDEEHLSPTEAICKAASIRVKPIVMTALAAFFALVPMALAIERGSEANAPLGRAVIGGLLAGLLTTLFVVPALYSLVIRDEHSAGEQHDAEPHDGPSPHAVQP